jgi:serine/threonine protein kinase
VGAVLHSSRSRERAAQLMAVFSETARRRIPWRNATRQGRLATLEERFPRMLGGRFRLESKLGQGGMGVVYAATDTAMGRPVAIKVILPDPSVEDEAVARFLREARTTAQIRHPHIVQLYDIGRGEAGELFFVMERLQGKALADVLVDGLRMTPDRVIGIATQICGALGHAHELGFVHRDLKPANIMILRTNDDTEKATVLDFGVAKGSSYGTQLTRTGMLVGTIEYMAPEQIRGEHIDSRADIYALGMLLYRMLSGTPVFRETAVPTLIKSHMNVQPDSLRTRVPDARISEALDITVLRCLAKHPDGRPATMELLAKMLLATFDDPDSMVATLPRKRSRSVASRPALEVFDPDATQIDGKFVREQRLSMAGVEEAILLAANAAAMLAPSANASERSAPQMQSNDPSNQTPLQRPRADSVVPGQASALVAPLRLSDIQAGRHRTPLQAGHVAAPAPAGARPRTSAPSVPDPPRVQFSARSNAAGVGGATPALAAAREAIPAPSSPSTRLPPARRMPLVVVVVLALVSMLAVVAVLLARRHL